jgi:hypothetical protein
MSEDFNQFLGDAMRECDGSSAISMDRNRPYNGQPWTDTGIRGQQLVEGLTMRDICDCYIRGIISSCNDDYLKRKMEENTLKWDDIYDVDFNDIDLHAIRQNLTCHIERMMGIFPNVPKLEKDLL